MPCGPRRTRCSATQPNIRGGRSFCLTDGQDTTSQVHMQDAIDSAVKVDALIYAIGIGDRYSYGIDEGSLKKITEATGGRAYFPRNERELRDAFAQIERDLREQYLIAYSPSNKGRDGAYRRVTIEITNPESATTGAETHLPPRLFCQIARRRLRQKARKSPEFPQNPLVTNLFWPCYTDLALVNRAAA